jgi:hypothetical protein
MNGKHGGCAGARAQATSTTLTLKVGTCSLPHPEKLDTGGEDAFFVSSDKSALGVAGAKLHALIAMCLHLTWIQMLHG